MALFFGLEDISCDLISSIFVIFAPNLKGGMKKIQMVDLISQLEKIKPSVDQVINEVLSKAQFINGPEVKAFQTEFQEWPWNCCAI